MIRTGGRGRYSRNGDVRMFFSGVYLVGNIGRRHQVSFRTCLIGAYLPLPVFMLTVDLSDLIYVLLFCAVSAATSALGKSGLEGNLRQNCLDAIFQPEHAGCGCSRTLVD